MSKKAKAVVSVEDVQDRVVSASESIDGQAAQHSRRGPGRVDVGGRIVLHTPQANELFTGKRPGLTGQSGKKSAGKSYMGLIGFAGKAMHIWTAARNNDPYADFMLLKIEEEFGEIVKLVASTQQHVTSLLESLEGIEMSAAVNVSPVEHDLKFICPWAYRAATLLSRYDRLALDGITCRRVGLIFGDDWFKTIVEPASRIRRWFALSKRWVNTGVSRKNVESGDAVARRAVDIYREKFPEMLQIPESVLSGKQRASVSPVIVVAESADLAV